MIDLIITLGSLALFVWFVIIEPLLRRLRSLRPSLPPPRYAPLRESEEDTFLNQLRDCSSPDEFLGALRERYPVPYRTGTDQYVPVRGGTGDTTEENQDDPRYARVLDLVKKGYSGNQIVELEGGRRATILALVKRAREEVGR